MDDYELFEQIMSEGAADVDCTECGYGARIEPDGDYECHEKGCKGRLVSPLITAGLM
jgi:hypothetical protein